MQYALAESDRRPPAAFTGATLDGGAIAQDWLNLDAEQAPSNFRSAPSGDGAVSIHDRRSGWAAERCSTARAGRSSKGWTVTSQPAPRAAVFRSTPIYLTSVAGTGVTGDAFVPT